MPTHADAAFDYDAHFALRTLMDEAAANGASHLKYVTYTAETFH